MVSTVLVLLGAITSVLAAEPLAVGRFFNPPNPPVTPVRGGGYSVNPVWTSGSTESIEWTTTFSNYTIVLWQQSLQKAESSKGPAIFQTERGAVTQFDWVVQDFEFDLAKSNVFFLWLHPGPYSQNGDVTELSITSRYFNITSEPAISSIISSSSQLTTSSVSETPTLSPATQSEAQTTSSSTSSSPVSQSPVSATPEPANNTNTSGGLTTSAKVGVGVGVTAGVFSVALTWFIVWSFRRRRNAPAEEQGHSNGLSMGFFVRSVIHKKHSTFKQTHPVEVESGYDLHKYTNEMAGDHKRPPVELA